MGEGRKTVAEKARRYADDSLWGVLPDPCREGWPALKVVSAASGNTYVISYSKARGGYVCNCPASRDCWHIVSFRNTFYERLKSWREENNGSYL